MRKLLPIIMLILGVGGGIGAGIMLAPAPEAPTELATEEGEDATVKPAEEETHAEDEDDHASDEAAIPNEFIKINNQFIIPVMEREQLTSMVVVSLSLEMKPGLASKVHSYEPKIRDVFLRILFDHANMGGFRGAFTRSEILDPLRTALREEGRRYLGKDLVDVLILEITRQDV